MADHGVQSLDKLPSELIAQIASLSSPGTILILSRVSKSLREICYDPFVFLDVFRNRKWAKQYLQDHTNDISLIARYAVAEWRFQQYVQRLLAADEVFKSELWTYLPNLAVMQHPDVDFDHGLSYSHLCQENTTEAQRAVVSLVGACAWLLRAPYAPSSTSLRSAYKDYTKSSDSVYFQIAQPLAEIPFGQRHFHANCLIGLGKVAILLSCAYPNLSLNPNLPPHYMTAGQRHSTHVSTPVICRMSLTVSPSDIPLPCTSSDESLKSWERWLRHKRRARSVPEFMDSGEWIGIYLYHDGFNIFELFEPPMTGIRFHTQGPLTRAGGFISNGSGSDHIGDFDLTCTMDADGYIRGRKTYRLQPISWDWHLSNTPFGLYGLWTSPTDNVGEIGELGGAVWLWKREWCE